jgi:hypothetical protein
LTPNPSISRRSAPENQGDARHDGESAELEADGEHELPRLRPRQTVQAERPHEHQRRDQLGQHAQHASDGAQVGAPHPQQARVDRGLHDEEPQAQHCPGQHLSRGGKLTPVEGDGQSAPKGPPEGKRDDAHGGRHEQDTGPHVRDCGFESALADRSPDESRQTSADPEVRSTAERRRRQD